MNKVKSFFGLGNFILSLKDSVGGINKRLDSYDNEIIMAKNNDIRLASELEEIKKTIHKVEYRLTRMEDLAINGQLSSPHIPTNKSNTDKTRN